MNRKTNKLLEDYLNLLILEKIEKLELKIAETKKEEEQKLESLRLEGELSVMNQLLTINDYYLFNLLERQKKSKIEACLKLSKELDYSELTGYLQSFLSKNIVTNARVNVENKFKSLNNFPDNVRIKFT